MKKRILIFLVILTLLAGTTAAFTAVGESRRSTVTISKDEYDRLKRYEKLDEVMQYIKAYYYKEADSDKMLDYAVQGMLSALGDPYTFYYDAESWQKMWEDDAGEYTGIGIQLLGNGEDGTVRITRVFHDTPAEKVGIKKNDLLVRVEDIEVDVTTMDAAVSTMRGEVGGTVEVEVKRGEENIVFNITRDNIHINNLDYTMLENGVGYLIIYQFASDTLVADFNTALNELHPSRPLSCCGNPVCRSSSWICAIIPAAGWRPPWA